jgi:hypothetical protein
MTPEQIRAQKNDKFATFDDMDQVIGWATESGQAVIAVGIAANTILELLAKEMELEQAKDKDK